MDAETERREIARNVAVHDKVARKYDAIHGEIFNPIEQARLRGALARAIGEVRTGTSPVRALDFGCGSGNLSRHLLDLGAEVTAADVSPGFLDLVRARYPTDRLTPHHMAGGSLAGLADASFDLIATYSVLHHIPDYLGAVAELARVCKPGGIIMIDHEATEELWLGDPQYRALQRDGLRFDWRKYLTPANYYHRVRRVFNPRHSNEGDIHVWPDDHIEWTKIRTLLEGAGFEVVVEEDYLLSRALYRPDVYARFVGRCTDTKVMILRKGAA